MVGDGAGSPGQASSKRLLVFQHLEAEHPGVFREFWAETGHRVTAVELDRAEAIPALEDFDLLIVMGGAQDVWETDRYPWLIQEMAAIRAWVREQGKPYLGICLGHQLLAAALGGTVGPMLAPEVGLTSVALTPAGRADPLFAGFGPALPVFQWHGAEVTTLPPGAEVLAGNQACPVQALRWGRHAYGLQFHPEICADTVEDWQRVPEYWASLQQALGRDAAAELAGQVTPRLPDFRDTARQIDRNLAAILQASS